MAGVQWESTAPDLRLKSQDFSGGREPAAVSSATGANQTQNL